MYKASSEVIKFIENTMENWRVELTDGGKNLTEVKILGGISTRCAITIIICNNDVATQPYT